MNRKLGRVRSAGTFPGGFTFLYTLRSTPVSEDSLIDLYRGPLADLLGVGSGGNAFEQT